jgi:proline iminopeptidase
MVSEQPIDPAGRYVAVGDTRLFAVIRGAGFPVIVLHGGPGLDHCEFADYLDALTDGYQLILVDQRAQGRSDKAPEATWTLEHMARDVSALAQSLGFARYAVLGHSYGAFVALHHAVLAPGAATATIISSGVPSMRFLAEVAAHLEHFEPQKLRAQVADSWAREASVQTQAEMDALMADQWPFQFADPRDPRIPEYHKKCGLAAGAVYAPEVLRHFSRADVGGIEVEAQLHTITQPVLVLAGRHDRTCVPAAAEAMARGIPLAELRIFERSGHMTFVEEPEAYRASVRAFLDRTTSGLA